MKKRILIVEDNVTLSQIIRDWLEREGYAVATAIDEPFARKLLRKEPFDLILSDVRLPQGDGIHLLEWIIKEKVDIPFVIMTEYASVTDAVKAIKLGAKDYLSKPVFHEQLVEMVNLIHLYGEFKLVCVLTRIAVLVNIMERMLCFFCSATNDILIQKLLNFSDISYSLYQAIKNQILMLSNKRKLRRQVICKQYLSFREGWKVFFLNSTKEIVVGYILLAADFNAHESENIGSTIVV